MSSSRKGTHPEGSSKPFIEGLRGVEHSGQHKVEQGPQLPQAVLDGGPRQQHPVLEPVAAQNLC